MEGRIWMMTQRLGYLVVFWFACSAVVVGAEEIRQDDPLVHTAHLSLQNGSVSLGEVLAQMLEWVGFDGGSVRKAVTLQIAVAGPAGKIQLQQLEKVTDGIVRFKVDATQLTLTLDRVALRAKEKQIRHQVRVFMEQWFPEQAAAARMQYGLRVVRPNGQRSELPHHFAIEYAVVLVHGIDEPGDIWDSLIPHLQKAGYTAIEFFYPNDQPIVDSAKLLAVELARLRGLGIEQVSLVSHSMGGLVCREMLTSPEAPPEISDTELTLPGALPGGLPGVDRLIMVGTPNGGSSLAPLRLVGEMREQVIRYFSGDGGLFGSMFDGAGEAQVDLLPGSSFLRTLNARPHPAGVHYTSIAGIASPISEAKIRQWDRQAKGYLSKQGQAMALALRGALAGLVRGVGDGCVSLASTRLAGVTDHVTVEANHRTLLRQVGPFGEEVPVAIPIILDRLSDKSRALPVR